VVGLTWSGTSDEGEGKNHQVGLKKSRY
jgi:hypothetical protein